MNTRYPVEHDEMLILNSQQWIQDVAFPARLYLKPGVENLTATELVDQTEPLLLDGLGKYAIRHFLQQQDEQTSVGILQDQFPVGKGTAQCMAAKSLRAATLVGAFAAVCPSAD